MKNRRSTAIWFSFFFTALLIFSAFLGYRWAKRENLFNLEIVRIRGCSKEDSSAVAAVFENMMNKPLGDLDIRGIVNDLEKISGVNDARIKRYWPKTLFVELTAEEPFLILNLDGKMNVLSRNGSCLPENLYSDTLLCLFLDSSLDTAVIPAVIELADSMYCYGNYDDGFLAVMENMVIWKYIDGKRVILGDENLFEKWLLYEELIRIDVLPLDWDELDLRFSGQVVLRRDSEPEDESNNQSAYFISFSTATVQRHCETFGCPILYFSSAITEIQNIVLSPFSPPFPVYLSVNDNHSISLRKPVKYAS